MTTLAKVQALLVEEFGLELDQVAADAQLDTLGIDSLATIEFMFLLEDKFNLKMPGEPVAVKTVGDIVAQVDAILATQPESNAS